MSIIDRLFPASELEALRASPLDLSVYPGVRIAAKRRKISHDHQKKFGSDSGYSSDEETDTIVRTGSRKRSRPSLSSTSSKDSVTIGKDNTRDVQGHGDSSSLTHSSLFRKYIKSLPPSEQSKYRLRTKSTPTMPHDLQDFYSHITLARSRAQSVSSPLLTPPYSPRHQPDFLPEENSPSIVPHPDKAYTAGPKSALAAALSARIFDGVRLTGNERSMLDDLLLGDYPTQPIPNGVFLASQEGLHCKTSLFHQSTFAGIAMPVSDEEDEDETIHTEQPPELDLDGMKTETDVGFLWQGEGTGKVEDFFDLQEACDDNNNGQRANDTPFADFSIS